MAAATKTAKVAVKATAEESVDKQKARLELGKEVMALRDEGVKWAEVNEQVEGGLGALMFAEMCARVKPSERVKYSDSDELGQFVVDLRDNEKLSWGVIAARCNTGEGKIRSAYSTATGADTIGNRIGKGGRFPTEGERPAKAPKAAKAAGGATKAAGRPSPLAALTLKDLKARLDLQTVTLASGDKVQIKAIQKKNPTTGQVTLRTLEGKSMTIPIADIKKATKPKVEAEVEA